MKKILVIGSSNIDFVVNVPYMPAVGETIMGGDFTKIPGGKGANQAFACGKLGGDTAFLSTVGDDDLGQLMIHNLASAGVDTRSMRPVEGKPTGMALIYVNKQGNNSIVVVAGANTDCSVEYIEEKNKIFGKSDILLVQMEVPHESVYYAIKKAKSMGIMVILNPAPAPDSIPDEIYKCVDVITPNETELQKLSGCEIVTEEDAKCGSKVLLQKGVKNVLVTLGSKGAMLVNEKEATLFSPPDIKVVDTTAAGDTFNAAFSVMVAEEKSFHDAIRFANIASTISVSRKGAQTSVPSRQEVMDFSEALKK